MAYYGLEILSEKNRGLLNALGVKMSTKAKLLVEMKRL